jgi:hypothetical protein
LGDIETCEAEPRGKEPEEIAKVIILFVILGI